MAHPVSNITVKSGANAGNQVNNREITLIDQTMKTIKMTLWDDQVHLVNEHLVNEHDDDALVIAVKGAKVTDFGGRSLSMTRKSSVTKS
jgi:replication factor A1